MSVNSRRGSLIPKRWFLTTPYHQVTWHGACALPNFAIIKSALQYLSCCSSHFDEILYAVCCAQDSRRYPKTQKMLFLDLAPPTLQNSGMFHDSTRPHLHFDGLPPKSWRSVVSMGALQVLEEASFWFGLEPPTRRSPYKSAHKCIPYNNRCMQNLIQIGWDLAAVQGPKTCFGVKTENGKACQLHVTDFQTDNYNYLDILSVTTSELQYSFFNFILSCVSVSSLTIPNVKRPFFPLIISVSNS